MNYKDFFLTELDREMPKTRKLLALVPEGKYGWKPHTKSYSLGELASHLTQLTGFAISMAEDETYDFSSWRHASFASTSEMLAEFDALLDKAKAAIGRLEEADFQKGWSMVSGETVVSTLQRWDALQNIYLHHIIHHRAQLGVYLRLLDIAIPGTYGPSADSQ